MHYAKAIALGLLVFSIVWLLDSGLEAWGDKGAEAGLGSPPLFAAFDALTPFSAWLAGLLAGTVAWTGRRSRDLSSDVLVTVIAALVAMAAIMGAVTFCWYFHYLNGVRPTPWYRYALGIACYVAMGWVVARNILEARRAKS